jgi:broad specificity phosphatase PhoE
MAGRADERSWPPVKTLLLVRHGEASWQGDEYDVLTERGEGQSRIVGTALAARGVVPDLVLSGELERHRRSAELAVESAGWTAPRLEDARWAEMDFVDVIKGSDPRFRSHADLRAVAGDGPAGNEAFVALLQEALQVWMASTDANAYIESFENFCTRVSAAFDHAVAHLDDEQTAVVFTSGGPIGAVANRALEGPPSLWKKLLVSVNAGVSKFLVLPDDTLVLVSLNDHAHVETAGVLSF